MTHTAFQPLVVIRSPITKSIEIESNFHVGIGKG